MLNLTKENLKELQDEYQKELNRRIDITTEKFYSALEKAGYESRVKELKKDGIKLKSGMEVCFYRVVEILEKIKENPFGIVDNDDKRYGTCEITDESTSSEEELTINYTFEKFLEEKIK